MLSCCCDADADAADVLLSRRLTASFVLSRALVSLCRTHPKILDWQCTSKVINVDSYSERCPESMRPELGPTHAGSWSSTVWLDGRGERFSLLAIAMGLQLMRSVVTPRKRVAVSALRKEFPY